MACWVRNEDLVTISPTQALMVIGHQLSQKIRHGPNTAAASITLTTDEQQQLEAATARLPVIGERYTPEGMKGVNA